MFNSTYARKRFRILSLAAIAVVSLVFLAHSKPLVSPASQTSSLNQDSATPAGQPSPSTSPLPSSSPAPYTRYIPYSLNGTREPNTKQNFTFDTTINTPIEINFKVVFGDFITKARIVSVSTRRGSLSQNLTLYYRPLPWWTGVDNFTVTAFFTENDGSQNEWTGNVHIRIRTAVVQNKATLIPPAYYKFNQSDNIQVKQVLAISVNKTVFPEHDTWLNRRYKTCAVIGNGGSLKGSKRGAEIDAHDVVVRINLSPFLEFSEDVGSKLDIAFANGPVSNWCWKRNSTLLPVDRKYEIMAQATYKIQWLRLQSCRDDNYPNITFTPMSYFFMDLVDNILNEYNRVMLNGTEPKYRSTGMLAVTAMAMICDHVSIYGFERGPNMEYYYYDSMYDREWNGHSYEAEKEYYRDLAKGTGLFESFLELYDLYTSFSYVVD